MTSDRMSALEKRATAGLACIFALRMLGMFSILPVFALYAAKLPGGQNRALVGIALGAYGLTQAILQIPFGWASDRYGRKRLLYIGLLLFAVGSFIAAGAQDIWWVIVGRVVQGAGAISGVVIAMTADLTRDQHRTKAMAIIGMTIGVTFALSLILSPWLAGLIDVPGIFALTGFLVLASLWVVYRIIPTPHVSHGSAAGNSNFLAVFRNTDLARLNLGIFVLHAVLMALFVVVPFALRDLGFTAAQHWQVYLPVMLAAFVLMIPVVIAGEKKVGAKTVLILSIALLIVSQLLLAGTQHYFWGIAIALTVFFTAFNVLEASLPAMISRAAPAGAKGTATGIYSSVQFLGAFAGAAGGGIISQRWGANMVFAVAAIITGIWLLAAWAMRPLPVVRAISYALPRLSETEAQQLLSRLGALQGVSEAVVVASERMAYLKVQKNGFDEAAVRDLIAGYEK